MNTSIVEREVVKHTVKICIECGDIGVKIDNDGIYCQKCNSKFQREACC